MGAGRFLTYFAEDKDTNTALHSADDTEVNAFAGGDGAGGRARNYEAREKFPHCTVII